MLITTDNFSLTARIITHNSELSYVNISVTSKYFCFLRNYESQNFTVITRLVFLFCSASLPVSCCSVVYLLSEDRYLLNGAANKIVPDFLSD